MMVAPAAASQGHPSDPGPVAVADPATYPVAPPIRSALESAVAVPEWFESDPAIAPQGRSTGAFAYDADSDRAVLFGGRYPGSQTLDYTWAYDYRADAWQNMSPSIKPSGREGTRMVYDTDSDRIILYGGWGAPQETWEYDFDNNTWSIISTASVPPPRTGHCMAHDSKSDRTVLFGGSDTSLLLKNDTWVFDYENTTWTKMFPSVIPPITYYMGCTYDAQSDRVVMFGGASPNDSTRVNSTWVYDFESNNWTKKNPPVTPTPRSAMQMAYDAESDRVILFAGYTGAHNDETWWYDVDADRWQQQATPMRPPLRTDSMLAYASEHDRVLLFGGNFGGTGRNDTWAFAWRLATDRTPSEPLNLTATPGNRSIALAWSPPVANGSGPVTGYRIYRGASSGGETFLTEIGNLTAHLDPGLASGSTYFYRVSARNAFGESPLSAETFATTPTAPLVQGVDPLNGSSGVEAFRPIVVAFDQTMNWSSVSAAFSISPPVLDLSYSSSGVEFRAWHNLTQFEPSTTYSIRVDRNASNQAGVPMDADFTSTFDTASGPRVTTTIPAANATGVALTSLVRVYFDTSMDPASTAGSFNITPFVPGVVSMTSARLSFSHSVAFDPFTVYTVRVNASARSTLGYSISPDLVFSFTTQGSNIPPTVIDTVPASGAQDVPAFQNVTITFSKSMEPVSTGNAFSISPTVAGTVEIAGQSLFWNHSERFAPGGTYTVRIASSATSLDGASMSSGHAFQFQVTPVTPWPKVSATAPGNNSGNVPLDIRVSVIFDQVMDPSSTVAAFSISPAAGGATTELSGIRLYWNHTALLSPFTTYTGTVAATARSAQGVSMIADYWFEFTTGTTTSPRPPELSMTPADGAVGVGLNRSLVLTFTEPMNERSAERALSVAPAVGLGFIWDVDSKVLTVSPSGGWASSTTYDVSVSTSATSQAGESMRAPFESSFTTTSGTGTGPVDPGTVSLLSTLGCAALIVILIVVGLLLFTRFRRQGGTASPAAPPPVPPATAAAPMIVAPALPPALSSSPSAAPPPPGPIQSSTFPPLAVPPPRPPEYVSPPASRVPSPPPPPSSTTRERKTGTAAEVPSGTISDWPEKEES